MDSQAKISPGAIVGAIITLVAVAIAGLAGLRVLLPFVARCDDAEGFTEECLNIGSSAGASIGDLVGPLGLIVLVLLLITTLLRR